jgi:hypothetical protein
MRLFSVIVTIGLVLFLTLNAVGCKSSSQKEAESVLDRVLQDIRSEMNSLDHDLAAAAQKLSTIDLAGAQAREVLSGLLPGRPYVVDVCTISRSAKLLAIAPPEYHEFEGSDLGQQEQVVRLFRTGGAVLSLNFRAVEGFEAADMEQPVYSPAKILVGSVSALFKPEILAGDIINKATGDSAFSLMLMQPDGRIVYDADETEIGNNTFIDPIYQAYPQLLELAAKVSAMSEGSGQYQFLDTGMKKNVDKEALWKTFSLHGATWRIVLIRTIS